MLKKLIITLLIAAMVLPVFGEAQAANLIPTAYGIDVSHHQGVIDWDTVAEHIDFAILRCGYGSDITSQDDRQWKANVEACTRLKIPFGVYIYSYATTEAEAISEANHVLRLLKGYNPSMPVYLDLEDEKIANNCTPAQILANATVFCNMIAEAGYTPGIYANTNWWNNYLSSSQYDKWDRWVARYNSTLDFNRSYSMWQYTSKGSVPGITGDVDMNYWYGEKPGVGTPCNHSYTFKTVAEPTCTESGIRLYTCAYCGDTYEKKISPKGHAYKKSVTLPTCTDSGVTTYTCGNCGHSYVEQEVPATGHRFLNGICTDCGVADPGNVILNPFEDIKEEDYFYEPVLWAVEEGITNGIGEGVFGPENPCTRGQIVTFLWRAYGSPEPKGAENPFSDMTEDAYYHKAVLWAVEQGITTGISETAFGPDKTCTRAQVATFLWRAQGKPLPMTQENPFADIEVDDYYSTAVLWAVEEGITNGTGNGLFSPNKDCTRGQIVTFLHRAMA